MHNPDFQFTLLLAEQEKYKSYTEGLILITGISFVFHYWLMGRLYLSVGVGWGLQSGGYLKHGTFYDIICNFNICKCNENFQDV